MIGSDLAFSSPGSHSSIIATAAKGEGSTKAGSGVEEVASNSPLAIREDVTATADIPPQLPSPSPGANVVADGPSTRSLVMEHIEHRTIDPTNSPYDIV